MDRLHVSGLCEVWWWLVPALACRRERTGGGKGDRDFSKLAMVHHALQRSLRQTTTTQSAGGSSRDAHCGVAWGGKGGRGGAKQRRLENDNEMWHRLTLNTT